jgi:hypothetical protein
MYILELYFGFFELKPKLVGAKHAIVKRE